jgi:hypothetical protein
MTLVFETVNRIRGRHGLAQLLLGFQNKLTKVDVTVVRLGEVNGLREADVSLSCEGIA